MKNTPLYSYTLSGRRPGTVFALCACLIMLGFGLNYGAPWYFLAPVGLAGAMALCAIIDNPQTGSTLTKETLRYSNRGHEKTVRVADIASMSVVKWTDGPDKVALTLKSGNVLRIPGMCADSKLAMALRNLGITETSAR